MAVSGKEDVVIDKEIPIERQIAYLRKGALNRELVTYQILKERLGEQGEDIYRAIKESLMQRAVKDLGIKLEFEAIKRQAGQGDKIMGYRLERDYEKAEEFQVSMLNCPYFEASKEHGLEKEICKLICDWEAEQVRKMGCEMEILSKIADGAEKCTLRIRKRS
jgi:predicted ArsR family transcriptional regulator